MSVGPKVCGDPCRDDRPGQGNEVLWRCVLDQNHGGDHMPSGNLETIDSIKKARSRYGPLCTHGVLLSAPCAKCPPNGVSVEPTIEEAQAKIREVCDGIRDLLIEKNKAYGNSAICPKRVFSKASAIEQINVRIDDKLSRIKDGEPYRNEDTELDLIGYLVLKRVAVQLMVGGVQIVGGKTS